MILKNSFSRWCVWCERQKAEGKPSKVPISPHPGHAHAATNKPETFGTYEEAHSALSQGGFVGLGLLMSSAVPDDDGPGVICIDVDDCIGSDGNPSPIAEDAFALFKGYAEISHSKRGLHFFLRGTLPDGCNREKVTHDEKSIEVYTAASTRFIAATGNEVRDGAQVINEQAALEAFLKKYGFMRDKTGEVPTQRARSCPTDNENENDEPEHSDDEIHKLMRTRNKRGRITRLFSGDLADHNGGQSEADLALCAEIAYYTTDSDQVARIFATSKLADRGKWRERADYRVITIKKALDGATGYYWDDVAGVVVGKAEKAAETRYSGTLAGGTEGLALTKRGTLAATIDNGVQVLLRDHRTQGVMGFNLFSGAVEVARPLRDVFGQAASASIGEFVESDVTAVRAFFDREYQMGFTKNDALDILFAWARHVEFNPVTDALDRAAAAWDQFPRLDSWLSVYLGVDASGAPEYHRAIGRAWMIGAVARAYAPGSKMDNLLILEGGQGSGKSRAAKAICSAIYPQGFVETIPIVGDSKEAALALRGAWIVELQELTSIRKSDSEQIKSFISTQADRVRVPYARAVQCWDRRCVFIGTTNEDSYIQDTSGGRRFWSCKIGRIDVDRLSADAIQLWGEAVTAYRRGEQWHLADAEALKQATAQQAQRQVSDPWDDDIANFIDGISSDTSARSRRWSLVALFDLVFPSAKLGNSAQDFDQGTQKRFATRLRQAGFDSRKTGGRNVWQLKNETIAAIAQTILDSRPIPPNSAEKGFALGTPKVTALNLSKAAAGFAA